MIRINPHLSYIAPNCTYDQFPEIPLETKEDCSEQNLLKLEARVEELERRLRLASQSPTVSPLASSIHSPIPHPGVPIEPFVPIPTGYDPSSHQYSPTDFPLMADDWPLELPPKPLMLHLIDLFFTCYPNSRRIIHRPTFLLQLLEHPSSPRFPFIPLLHSICAAAAAHSPHVTVAPLPDLRKYPSEDIFQDKTRVDQGRALMFDEQHFLLSKYQCMTAAREGVNLLGVIQACVINAWWAFSCARWFDVWAMNSLAMRMCIALGLNFADSLHKPLPDKTREKLLIGPPSSHIDVELRRNAFWLAYCLERYHLFSGPWVFDINDDDIQQTLPATLEAFEAGFDDGQERQNIFSEDLFSTHYTNQDDFGMYIKCAIMLSRAHVFELRRLPHYTTAEEIRDSREVKSLESMIYSIQLSLKKKFNPINQLSTSATSNTFIVHLAPLWASIKLHIDIANWQDPSCESANKALAAARAILRYTTMLGSTSFEASRLDRVVYLPWLSAGRALVHSLKFAPESLAPILRAEIRLVKSNLQVAADRVIIFSRQLRLFDLEVVETLGEREAAKMFEGDMF
ncbi:fungal specific transcription factor domain protein [Rhizoctonia solani AG-3 Rhs1AP]|uniref:Fungal specific transcription factor domain protein n=2 Tax=Rhizoctonia solani AG-3 TaxID=1086053 RepID=A0A074RYZ0_9AGAM|nr:fungal specific transcription factor domain protein [Rhizoctonia solani AG-3 Rhs1AP]KEP52204.1 fungal specific transcription factor domain protein [Rhizoctonia solani 123E]